MDGWVHYECVEEGRQDMREAWLRHKGGFEPFLVFLSTVVDCECVGGVQWDQWHGCWFSRPRGVHPRSCGLGVPQSRVEKLHGSSQGPWSPMVLENQGVVQSRSMQGLGAPISGRVASWLPFLQDLGESSQGSA